MADIDFDPTQQALSPAAQVFSHILQKGIQAGSIIGICAVVPLTAAYALYRKTPVDKLQLLRKIGVSCNTGTALTVIKAVIPQHGGVVSASADQFTNWSTAVDRKVGNALLAGRSLGSFHTAIGTCFNASWRCCVTLQALHQPAGWYTAVSASSAAAAPCVAT
jgi:hypothetical protein